MLRHARGISKSLFTACGLAGEKLAPYFLSTCKPSRAPVALAALDLGAPLGSKQAKAGLHALVEGLWVQPGLVVVEMAVELGTKLMGKVEARELVELWPMLRETAADMRPGAELRPVLGGWEEAFSRRALAMELGEVVKPGPRGP